MNRPTVREAAADLRSRLAAALNRLLGRGGLRLVPVARPPAASGRPGVSSGSPWPGVPMGNERVLLRRVAGSDLRSMVAACADEDLVFWTGWPAPFTEGHARRWLRGEPLRHDAGEALELALVDAATGEFAGFIELHQVDWVGGRASIGLWLAPQARGRGLMTQGLTLFVDRVFGETSLRRLELLTLAGNASTQALAERCGFRREGLLRGRMLRAGRSYDGVLFAAVRGD